MFRDGKHFHAPPPPQIHGKCLHPTLECMKYFRSTPLPMYDRAIILTYIFKVLSLKCFHAPPPVNLQKYCAPP